MQDLDAAEIASADGHLVLRREEGRNPLLRVTAPRMIGVLGDAGGHTIDLGPATLRMQPNELNYMSVFLLPRDGRTVDASRRMLLVAIGNQKLSEQTKAKPTPERFEGPILTEALAGRVTLDHAAGPVRVYALDAYGGRVHEVPVSHNHSAGVSELEFELAPKYVTIWYEIESGSNN